ncbi:putative sensor domain DACNV-containing protein [Solidesulfovibrio sp. C21]|uniref:putative sensor domain DACNV-containing protein n=1 Tax=Solidesulfovibrio sp. C21 TaxID=3398613 RepID=UPI0039FCBFDE
MNNVISQFVAAIQASDNMDASAMDANNGATDLLRDADQLTMLCTACFWASLEMEERREVRGTLSLCSPASTLLAKAFTNSVPVTIPNLVALLTASPRTPLAVHVGSEGPAIWGVLDVEPDGLLRLRIAGNGTLLVSRSSRVLALLHKGTVSIPVAADEASLEHLIANALGKDNFQKFRPHVSDKIIVPDKLIRVGTTMIRHGHGGTLVLVPPKNQSWRRSVRFRFSFDEDSAKLLQVSVHDFEVGTYEAVRNYDDLVAGRNTASIIALRERYEALNFLRTLNQSLLRRVGDLSLIDGAVVMDLDLCLLGFGAILLFGPEDFLVTSLNAVTGELREQISLEDLGGMRHQSAARFVHGNRATEVFVVSQDGRLSLFSWSERMQCVAVVQNLEHFIWEYRTV